MPKIAGEYAFNISTGDATSASQDQDLPNIHFYGFDYAGKFKMMGVGDTVSLFAQGPAPFDMELEPDSALKMLCETVGFGVDTSEISRRDPTRKYSIVLKGLMPGIGKLFLKNDKTKAIVDWIEVQVVNNRLVDTRFYNLHDLRAGKQGCPTVIQRKFRFLAGGDLNTAVAKVNDIVQRQANVRMSLKSGIGGHEPLQELQVELGAKPFLNPVNINGVRGRPGFDGDADYHVCWVWPTQDPALRGLTSTNITFLVGQDSVLKDGATEDEFVRTVAHEFVHFLCGAKDRELNSHDPKKTDLMFPLHPQGIQMRKDRLKMIIR